METVKVIKVVSEDGLTTQRGFEDFLTERGDIIDGAAFDLLFALSGKTLEWDISIIRELVEYAEQILKEKDVPFCDPYYESSDADIESKPCAINGCENCKDCMFKSWLK